MNDVTSVHFTEPNSHQMNVRCTIQGDLHPESTLKLLKLYRKTFEEPQTVARPAPKLATLQPANAQPAARKEQPSNKASVAGKKSVVTKNPFEFLKGDD
jgi:hypothetical protein